MAGAVTVEKLGEEGGKQDVQHRHTPHGELAHDKQSHEHRHHPKGQQQLGGVLRVVKEKLGQGIVFPRIQGIVPELVPATPADWVKKLWGGAAGDGGDHHEKARTGTQQKAQVIQRLLPQRAPGIAGRG